VGRLGSSVAFVAELERLACVAPPANAAQLQRIVQAVQTPEAMSRGNLDPTA
jgi:hypothetical protein